MEKIEFLSAVIIVTNNMKKMVEFYRDVIGLVLIEEKHGPTDLHYGCELGDLHFAIHPASNFPDNNEEVGSIKLAFNTFDLDSLIKKVTAKGYHFEYEPKDRGFAKMTAIYDPDGNYIQFTQLSDKWMNHLKQRRSAGEDIVSKWELK